MSDTYSGSLVNIHVKIKEFIFYVNTAGNFVVFNFIIIIGRIFMDTGIAVDEYQSGTSFVDFPINSDFRAAICDDLS